MAFSQKRVPRRRPLHVEILEARTLLHGGDEHSEPLEAGVFNDLQLGLPGVTAAAVAWGDYDSDGNLDFLVSGANGTQRLARVFHNNGDGTFSDIHANLEAVSNGSVAWGDYDNDGRLDILLTGFSGTTAVSKIYHNDGGGQFSDDFAGLVGVFSGTGVWGDYDNDGLLDVLLVGANSSFSPVTQVYHNDGLGIFSLSAEFDGVFNSAAAAWGDLNSDGRLDFLVSGFNPGRGSFTSRIYQNNGNGTFTDIQADLPAGFNAAVDFGDYDSDGKLDIVLSGRTSGEDTFTKVLHNNGDGTFTDIDADLEPLSIGSLKWGDFNNDGRLDILMVGTGHDDNLARIYHNHGVGAKKVSGTFSPNLFGASVLLKGEKVPDTFLAAHFIQGNEELGVGSAGAAWGDYDNDGKLDILLAGSTSSGPVLRVYRNGTQLSNTRPDAPTGLVATVNSPSSVTLTWNPAADGQSSQAGLSYNLYVGTDPGGSDIVGPMAKVREGAGLRRIVQAGPIQGTSWTVTGLTSNTAFFWSVQAIDTGRAGSTFAAESTFTTKAAGAANLRFLNKPAPFGNNVGRVVVQLIDNAGQRVNQPGVWVTFRASMGAATRLLKVRTNAYGLAVFPAWLQFRPGILGGKFQLTASAVLAGRQTTIRGF